jgi:hypothetical protein
MGFISSTCTVILTPNTHCPIFPTNVIKTISERSRSKGRVRPDPDPGLALSMKVAFAVKFVAGLISFKHLRQIGELSDTPRLLQVEGKVDKLPMVEKNRGMRPFAPFEHATALSGLAGLLYVTVTLTAACTVPVTFIIDRVLSSPASCGRASATCVRRRSARVKIVVENLKIIVKEQE